MKKLVAILAVAWLGAVICTTYLWRELAALRGQKQTLQLRVNALEVREPVQAVAFDRTPQDAAVASAASIDSPVPVATPEATRTQADDLTRTMMRSSLTQMYPDVAEELDLTPDELEKFLDLLVNQRTSQSQEQRTADEDAMSALLGNRVTQWHEYQQTLPARRQVNQLRGQLAASGSVLSAAQARPLMTAIDAEQKRINQEARRNPPPRNTGAREQMELEMQRSVDSNRRLVAAATPHLDAQQLDSYRRMLDRQVEMMRTMLPTLGAMQEQMDAQK